VSNTGTPSSSSSSSTLLQQIKSAYERDDFCIQVLLDHEQKLNTSEWQVNSTGLIQRHGITLVPNDQIVRTLIISSNHDEIAASHRGVAKTISLISRTWYWKNMAQDIKLYVDTCKLCQQNKISNQAPQGLLHPIASPESRWHTVTMDLITSLPKTKAGNDCIVVFTDKLSKMVHYVPTVTKVNAEQLAHIMINHVVKLHGIPIHIISDRDARFTSSFWKALWLTFGTKLKMSTAYHPESDGQTERINRTLEEGLRNYVNDHQDNWDTLLPLSEFAYNNAVHSSTGYTPFFLNSGQHPTTPSTYEVRAEVQVNDAAATLVEQVYDALEHAQQTIVKAQAAQKKYADQHRKEHQTYNVGDLVYLSTKNIRSLGGAPKLTCQRMGPFPITKVISHLNYELELPASMRGIHNRFHVKLLTKAKSTDQFPTRPNTITRPPAIAIAGQPVYEVESILKHRGSGKKLEYCVKWKGYERHESTWEPVSAFKGHRDAIITYE
jgi:hypothetical protein